MVVHVIWSELLNYQIPSQDRGKHLLSEIYDGMINLKVSYSWDCDVFFLKK